jgi:hypothetical protein
MLNLSKNSSYYIIFYYLKNIFLTNFSYVTLSSLNVFTGQTQQTALLKRNLLHILKGANKIDQL